MTPRVSVILCTYNRAPRLMPALEALARRGPDTPAYEVILVDNASTDGTPAVIAEAQARWPDIFRMVRERRPGLSHARNTGVAAARAPLIAFTDDDVRVREDWVATIVRTFDAHPDAQWIGGRVLPRWPEQPPRWLDAESWAPLALQNHGDRAFAVGAGRPVCLIGANLAVRADAIAAHGGFDVALQRVGEGIGSTEDHAFQARLWRRGLTGWYEPALAVDAEVEPERLRRAYHRRWHAGHGRFVARMHLPEQEGCGRRVLGVPGHVLRGTLSGLARGNLTPACFAAGFIRERLAGRTAPAEETGLTSIVIPCFNHGAYLADAIRSALAQDRAEVIVVDDGSTDDSPAVARTFVQVRLIRQRNRGVSAARNAGLVSARGEFVLFLDADDRLLPGAVSSLRGALEGTSDAAMAHGRFRMIDRNGAPMPAGEPERRGTAGALDSLLRSNFICAPATVLYRRTTVAAAGGFARGIEPAADYDLFLRLSRTAAVVSVDEVVAEYRAHGGNMSVRADRMLASTLRAHGRHRPPANAPLLRVAWREGRAYWREFYGSQLIEQVRSEWNARRWGAVVRDMAALARFAPGVLLARARQALRRRM